MPTEEQREVFRRALQQARQDTGLSQRALAAALGLSPGAVSQWELGQTAPRPAMVAKIEQELKLDDGALGRLLGYLPAGVQERAVVSVMEAVEADPRLGPREREILAGLYRQLVRQRQETEGDS